MRRLITLFTLLVSFGIPALALAATWQIDPEHSSAQFKIRHLMVSNVKGEFRKLQGVVTIDDADITKSKVEATIDAASIDTGVVKRDNHLRSPDFFDVAKYPVITFVSKRVLKDGAERYKVVGDLTIHGVTREVALNVDGPTAEIKDPMGKIRRGASAEVKINRKDYGLTWNKVLEAGGVAVGDEVNIAIEVEMIKN